ncbi:MAG: hypothetical protein ONA90_07545, partial [candidate division KSB1 bacterium]|nr:hypothetical protein [candidate division KSB1 bacterium]
MPFPAGSIIFFLIWVAVTLVLWNLYHYSRALRKKTFIRLLLMAFFGLIGGIGFLYLQQQPDKPTDRTGLLIFPFIEKSVTESSEGSPINTKRRITPRSLAVADMIAEHVRITPDTPFYILPTSTVFDIANSDSLVDFDYILQFARRAQLEAIAFGEYTLTTNHQHQEHWQVDFRLIDFSEVKMATNSLTPTFA